ncbi:MAG: CMP deaminase [Spirochaetes bacterium RIFOXYC1_FULL_54_7]|nr:MAG: CMP deaminase [Spirochaetes bacterium RIFOXYC1_FULL_54_7]
MNRLPDSFALAMPPWFDAYTSTLPECIVSSTDRMALIIELSRLNIEHDTGGPFAAGVFELKSGRIISLGVNRVCAHDCSSAHAEVMALSLAQKRLGTYDLGGPDLPEHELVVNWLPCCMCYGATIWSGVKRLTIAGHGPELEEITGFDEGPRPADWVRELESRGIRLASDILRNEAIAVYKEFRNRGRLVYAPRQGSGS